MESKQGTGMDAVKKETEMISGKFEFTDRKNNLNDIMSLIMTVASAITNFDAGSIWLTDNYDAPSEIRLGATKRIKPNRIGMHSLKLNQGVVGHIVRTRKSFVANNIMNEPRFVEKKMAFETGLVSMHGIPMIDDSRVAGVINCYSPVSGAFDQVVARKMEALARQAARMIVWRHRVLETEFIKNEFDTKEIIDRAKKSLMILRGMDSVNADAMLTHYSRHNGESLRTVAEAALFHCQTASIV